MEMQISQFLRGLFLSTSYRFLFRSRDRCWAEFLVVSLNHFRKT